MEKKSIIKIDKIKSWDEALSEENWILPKSDIFETENYYVLTVNLPGVNRELIKVKVDNNFLIVMGRINYEEHKRRNYIMLENEIGNFIRKFKLTDSVDISKIEAGFENGQLNVKIAKNSKVKTKHISVQ